MTYGNSITLTRDHDRRTLSGPGGSESYDYAADSNRLLQYTTGSGSYAVSYDANGNLSGDGYWGFSYGDHNRMTEARAQGTVVGRYRYNGLGQRVSKDKGAITLFVYDEAGRLLGEYDAQGFPLRETVWLDGAPLAVVADDVVHFVHTDRLGTPRAITTGAGSVIWRWDPEPFGDSAPDQDPDGDGVNAIYPGRFPGQYFDVETTLHYNYFRDYIPEFGRYVESDPIGLQGGLNTYGYALQNPLRYTDHHGLAILPNFLLDWQRRNADSGTCDDDTERRCDSQYYDVDIPTCNGISRMRGAEAAQRCFASAMRRYAACLNGEPIPDLDTYDNRDMLDYPADAPTPPTTDEQLPLWLLIFLFLIPPTGVPG